MNKDKKIIYFFLISIFLCGDFFAFDNFISASTNTTHIVISEIQISGETVNDEFIELYNPTNAEINLENWDLKKKTKSGSASNILNNITGVIPAQNYFLITPRANCGESKMEKCYQGSVVADDEYTTNIFLANDNTILLYDDKGNLIDKVGWGKASDFEGEVSNLNLENKKSLARKIINNIIQDTNNNKNDFVLRDNPGPQNSGFIDNQDEENNSETESDSETSESDSVSDDNEHTVPQSRDLGNYGANGNIIITEFLPNPEGSDKEDEFIELYNKSNLKVDLGGCVLEDKKGSVKKYIIPNGTKINAGKYKAFYSDETKIVLNNSGDGVVFKNSENKIIDETKISSSALKEQAFVLDENENWVWTLKPTPGRRNVVEMKIEKNSNQDDETDVKTEDETESNSEVLELDSVSSSVSYNFSDKIIISEIYPNSVGRDNRNGSYEWIELYNDSDQEVNLNGWMIDDILEKGSKTYLIENEIIKAGEYKIFDAARTKIALNNSGDEVNLLWADGTVVDKIKYEKANEGLSYNLSKNDDWFWSSIVTPEEENRNLNFVNKKNGIEYYDFEENIKEAGLPTTGSPASGEENLDYIEVNLKDINHLVKYSKIKTGGIVSTPPGIFADNIFYISGSGIQICSYNSKVLDLNIGDEIEIIGRISEIGGERRILLDRKEDLKIISHDNLVQSKIISTRNINKTVVGYLVTVEGKVSQIKNDVFYLDDGSGEVKIYLKPQTRIKKPEIKINDWMVITGQVSQTSAGFRILPRFQGDLKLSRVSGIAKTVKVLNKRENIDEGNKNGNFVFYGIMVIISFLILGDWIRIKMNKGKRK